ncbi:MAG TPA: Holliday junction resolvase RuvX [Myxococcota bacterium]|nr:Holliday junction resolvase RuvX [Myxococcota bacterium]
MASPTRVLAIDLGSKRIGLAISDESRKIAFPAGVIASRSTKADVEALRALAAEREVGTVVVGLPIHMDGRRGPEAARAQAFAEALGAATGLPVALLDERWTTRGAERALHEMGRSRKQQRGVVDQVAATLLLQTFLEREARSGR